MGGWFGGVRFSYHERSNILGSFVGVLSELDLWAEIFWVGDM
jgi:hypothetical protein